MLSPRPSVLPVLLIVALVLSSWAAALDEKAVGSQEKAAVDAQQQNLPESGVGVRPVPSAPVLPPTVPQGGSPRVPATPAAPVPVASSTVLYGPFWQVGNGYASTVLIGNRDQNPITAVVALFSNDGTQQWSGQLQVAPNSVGHLSLQDILPAGGSVQWGGLMVQFAQASALAQGEVRVQDTQTGAVFEERLQGVHRFDTGNALHAPWWLPDQGTDGTIMIFNASDQETTVVPEITLAEGGLAPPVGALVLRPHESRLLSLRNLLGGNSSVVGSVVLQYTGQAHALQPALLLQNKSTGFSLSPTFIAKHGGEGTTSSSGPAPVIPRPDPIREPRIGKASEEAMDLTENEPVESAGLPATGGVAPQTTRWQFPEVTNSVGTASGPAQANDWTVYALLTNGTQAAMAPQLSVYVAGSVGTQGQKISVPQVTLAPSETRLIDLSQLLGAGAVPAGVSHFGLVVSHPGMPGALTLAVFSVNGLTSQTFQADGVLVPSRVMDFDYWDMTTGNPESRMVQNRTGVEMRAQVTLYYETSLGVASYALAPMTLAGNGSQVLNLRQSILSGAPDAQGHTISAATTSGLAALIVTPATGTAEPCLDCRLPVSQSSSPAASQKAFTHGPVAGAALAACFAPAPPPAPPAGQFELDDITPFAALIGTAAVPATLTGSGFNNPSLGATGGITITRDSWTSTTIGATLGLKSAAAGTQKVSVSQSIGDGLTQTSSLNFSVFTHNCPTSITLKSLTAIPLNNGSVDGTFPKIETGVGAVAAMQANPTTTDWDGSLVGESLSVVSNTCTGTAFANHHFCTGNSQFPVGFSFGGKLYNIAVPATENVFYDTHSITDPTSLLNTAGLTSCKVVCTQKYSCADGTVIGTFTITETLTKGTLKNGTTTVNVTNVGVQKTAQ